YNLGNNIGNLYNIVIRSEIRFQRLLAKQVIKKELDQSKIRDVISENNSYNNVKCTSGDLSKYAELKKKGLNDMNLYKKLYKHRYSKKNILGKFDCYCEKKYSI
ncbi:CYIR protein, partial [Plasmodium cynomolgi strain B]